MRATGTWGLFSMAAFLLACGGNETVGTTTPGNGPDTSVPDAAAVDTGSEDSGADTMAPDTLEEPPTPPLALPPYLGGERPARYYLPLDGDLSEPLPLVILLHGFTSSAVGQDAYFGMSEATRERGFVLIIPDGRTNGGGAQFWSATDYCCNFYGAPDTDADYILGLIEEAKSYLPIDPARIALVGHSNGGFMSYRLACEASDVISHVVSLAGASWAEPEDCGLPAPVSVLQIHGAWDLTIRYGGKEKTAGNSGPVMDLATCQDTHCSGQYESCQLDASCTQLWACMNDCGWVPSGDACRQACYLQASEAAQQVWMEQFVCMTNAACFDNPMEPSPGYTSADETVARWVERNVCNSTMTEPANLDLESTIPGAETTRKTWEDCAKGTRTELWTIEKGGHVPRISGTFIPEILNWIAEHPRSSSNP